MLKKSCFVLDSGDEKPAVLEGYTRGDNWNGFACPLATREAIEKFMKEDSYASQWHFKGEDLYEPNEGYEDEPIVYKPHNEEGMTLYGLGFGLCWYKAEHLKKDNLLLFEALNNMGFYAMAQTDARFSMCIDGKREGGNPNIESLTSEVCTNIPSWIHDAYHVTCNVIGDTSYIKITEKE